MLKWKHDYLSKKRIDLKSDRGVTLIELLSALAILSIVILLAGSVHIFGQRQFISQTESASQSNDMSYALSVISQDLRKEAFSDVTIDENVIVISGVETFRVTGRSLYKKDQLLTDSIQTMDLVRDEEDSSLEIVLKNTSKSTQQKTYQTTIYFRR